MKILKEKKLDNPIGPLYKYKVLACELPNEPKSTKNIENKFSAHSHGNVIYLDSRAAKS